MNKEIHNLRQKAENLFYTKKYEEAIKTFFEILDNKNNPIDNYYTALCLGRIANSYYGLKNVEKSIEFLEKSISNFPISEFLYNLISIYQIHKLQVNVENYSSKIFEYSKKLLELSKCDDFYKNEAILFIKNLADQYNHKLSKEYLIQLGYYD